MDGPSCNVGNHGRIGDDLTAHGAAIEDRPEPYRRLAAWWHTARPGDDTARVASGAGAVDQAAWLVGETGWECVMQADHAFATSHIVYIDGERYCVTRRREPRADCLVGCGQIRRAQQENGLAHEDAPDAIVDNCRAGDGGAIADSEAACHAERDTHDPARSDGARPTDDAVVVCARAARARGRG